MATTQSNPSRPLKPYLVRSGKLGNDNCLHIVHEGKAVLVSEEVIAAFRVNQSAGYVAEQYGVHFSDPITDPNQLNSIEYDGWERFGDASKIMLRSPTE